MVGKMCPRNNPSIEEVAAPGWACCRSPPAKTPPLPLPDADEVPYRSGSMRYSCVTSETILRQKKRVSPLSAGDAMTSQTAGRRWSSMAEQCCKTSSVCCA